MIARCTPTVLTWRPLDDSALTARIDSVLRSWANTPYMAGQRAKGAGVDCLRYVTAALDELTGRSTPAIPNLPQDAALHDPILARETMRAIIRAYGPARRIDDLTVEPADVVVTGDPDGGPGHAMIVGAEPNTIWHSTRPRVHTTGVQIVDQKVFRIYRPLEKDQWPR